MQPDAVDSRPFSLLPYFPSADDHPLRRRLLGLVESLAGLQTLQRKYESLPHYEGASDFIERALESLDIAYHAVESQLRNIPEEGPAVVVANHPFGGVDGMIMVHLLQRIRPDVRVLANYHLNRFPALRDLFFVVDPFDGEQARRRNLRPLRESFRWLESGGLLMVFPAGEVSHFQFSRRRISDPEWSDTVGRIIMRTRAPVVPICFHGRNSTLFSLAGMIHPRLRTLLLARELVRKSHSRITLTIGKPIRHRKIACLASARELTDYLRLRCYLLESGEPARSASAREARIASSRPPAPVADPVSPGVLRDEIAGLGENCLLHRSDEFDVLVARPEQIPWSLQEIGRLREQTFRGAGEGTGKASDIDLFDTWYDQLFIWHRDRAEIAGAYRLGPVSDILDRRGKKGLYTHSLFRYRRSLLNSLGPALELGRSFVRDDYQKSFQALNLLWKGIGLYAARNDLAVLFGPVSVSRDYSAPSRMILVDSLYRGGFSSPLSSRVQPRRPVRSPRRQKANRGELKTVHDIDLVSDMVSQFEDDGKGMPVLMRQYLKMGGRFLGFSRDPEFSDVVDGLVVVDLRHCDERVLARFMGSQIATDYLARLRVGPGGNDYRTD